VRWPARPAEHRAGLDLFVSFSIKGKRKANSLFIFLWIIKFCVDYRK